MGGLGADSRAVSESAGVAALIAITVLATASVGLSVIIAADGGDGSSFPVEFQYSSDLSQLTVFYDGEEEVRAGDVVVDGPAGNFTWAELANVPENRSIAAGDQPVFLNEGSAYGDDVAESEVIRVIHRPEDGETSVAVWNEGGGEEDDDGGLPGDDPTDDPADPASATGVNP
ncbi:hypothetical protein BRC73_09065 [Halobacteriales archaeon QH_7_66_37]|nr:MAG: hypothetical protein BRC73_09065 [Halobacteriales archaeon QH_7_66_37]